MVEVLTSGKDTDRYHCAEQGFVALHIFILTQDLKYRLGKLDFWQVKLAIDLPLGIIRLMRSVTGNVSWLTGVSSAARNNVGVEVLFHASDKGWGNLEFLNIRVWDRPYFLGIFQLQIFWVGITVVGLSGGANGCERSFKSLGKCSNCGYGKLRGLLVESARKWRFVFYAVHQANLG